MPRWTPEARAAQSAKIWRWQPWRESTGPRTPEGKRIAAMNAEKHGMYSADARREKLYADALFLLAREEARAEELAATRGKRSRR